ncbi:MAG: 2-oxo acid dehydrogenase subunit E2 [Hyphomicrobiales bacterium]|nr:2-oxo acid dehydrogenase subunit E2 [Hyphomicrobiales bacterium]
MTKFRLPDLGEGLQEAEIVTWHVSPGDHVTADQPLVSVETDKAVVEIPSPQSGRIKGLFAESGDIVNVGDPLVEFEDQEVVDTGTVVGDLEIEPDGESDAKETSESGRPKTVSRAAVQASPAIRRLANSLGVNLESAEPTGHTGELTTADIERAAESTQGVEKLRGARRTMAKRMADSHARVVPATVVDDADIEAWFGKTDITPRLVRAITAGCRAEPALNAWYDDLQESRRQLDSIDLGIAVDTDDGLFVPVLRNVGHHDMLELSDELQRLEAAVRSRLISPEQLRGPTITLSNFGTLGGRYGALVIVPPQVAILGAGRVEPRVMAIDGAPTICHVLPLSLTFDHRAVTGGEAARFLTAVINDLERVM